MNAAVDILLPCRDAATTLPACLDSIARQTFTPWRLVAIDDGSGDDTANILRQFIGKHTNAILLNGEGRGLVQALNLGLRHVASPLVARMDADDIMHPERLARQIAYLRQHPDIGVVACQVEEEGYPPGFTHYLHWSNQLCSSEEIANARFIESPVVHPTVCFRREVAEQFGVYREGLFPEDYELWLRWLDAGVIFAKINASLMRWHDHPTRLTRIDPRYSVEAFFETKAYYLARWLEKNSPTGKRVWVWGAGYATRKRVRRLLGHGITIEAFIDIDPRKIGGRNRDGVVHAPDALPGPEHSFVLAAVGTRGARELIAKQLRMRGYVEGHHYVCVA